MNDDRWVWLFVVYAVLWIAGTAALVFAVIHFAVKYW